MKKLLLLLMIAPILGKAQITIGAGYSTKNFADLFARYNFGANGIMIGGSYQTKAENPPVTRYSDGYIYSGDPKGYSIYTGYSRRIIKLLALKVVGGYYHKGGYNASYGGDFDGKTDAINKVTYGGGVILKLNRIVNFEAEYLTKQKAVFDLSFNF